MVRKQTEAFEIEAAPSLLAHFPPTYILLVIV